MIPSQLSKKPSVFMACFLIVILFMSGCIEPSPVKPDTSHAFSLTQDTVEQSTTLAYAYLMNHLQPSGFFTENVQISQNLSTLRPHLLLQMHILTLICSHDSHPFFINQHQQLTQILIQDYIHTENKTMMYQFFNTSDSLILAHISSFLLTSTDKQQYTPIVETINTIIYNRYNNTTRNGTTPLSADNIQQECRTLSKLIHINMLQTPSFFPLSLLKTIYMNLSQDVSQLEKNHEYHMILPSYAHVLYELYQYTGDTSYAQDHLILAEYIRSLQNHQDQFGHFLIDETKEPFEINTTFTALCMQTMAQAVQITQTLNNTEHNETFETSLFLGLFAVIHMQENGTKNKELTGGFYIDETYDQIRLNTLATVLQGYYLINTTFSNHSWTYLYDGMQGYLTVDSTNNEPMTLWYLLSLGVILSIMFLFLLYGVLTFIKKRKEKK